MTSRPKSLGFCCQACKQTSPKNEPRGSGFQRSFLAVHGIKLIGSCALKAIRDDGQGKESIRERISTRVALLSLDLAFWWSAMKQYFGYGEGLEQELKDAEDRQLRETKDAVAELFGITVN